VRSFFASYIVVFGKPDPETSLVMAFGKKSIRLKIAKPLQSATVMRGPRVKCRYLCGRTPACCVQHCKCYSRETVDAWCAFEKVKAAATKTMSKVPRNVLLRTHAFGHKRCPDMDKKFKMGCEVWIRFPFEDSLNKNLLDVATSMVMRYMPSKHAGYGCVYLKIVLPTSNSLVSSHFALSTGDVVMLERPLSELGSAYRNRVNGIRTLDWCTDCIPVQRRCSASDKPL